VRFDAEGLYEVTLTVSNSVGSDDEIKSDYIDAVGVLLVEATADPDAICEGGSSQLNASTEGGDGNFTYSWTSDPAGFTSDEQNPVVEPDENTTYYVEVSDDLQSASDDIAVIVNPLPEIALEDWPEILCKQEEPPVQLSADPDGGIYSGDYVTEEGVFSPEDASLGWHVITYTFEDEYGCENNAQDSIFVDDCVGIHFQFDSQSHLVIYPNPNDGEFVIESDATILSVELINQVGKIVHSVENKNNNIRLNLKLEKGVYYLKAKLNVDGNEVWKTKKLLIN